MKIGSLFAGIGGLELGLEWAGLGEVVFQVERDPYCRAVLAGHWPHVPRFTDVHKVGAKCLPAIDLLCGGFPCQDVSSAGKRAGLGSAERPTARSGLWFEFERLVGELRPSWVVVENVASGAARWVPAVRRRLWTRGYDSLPVVIEASQVGARHRRARVFVVARHADPDGVGLSALLSGHTWTHKQHAAAKRSTLAPDPEGGGRYGPLFGWKLGADPSAEGAAAADPDRVLSATEPGRGERQNGAGPARAGEAAANAAGVGWPPPPQRARSGKHRAGRLESGWNGGADGPGSVELGAAAAHLDGVRQPQPGGHDGEVRRRTRDGSLADASELRRDQVAALSRRRQSELARESSTGGPATISPGFGHPPEPALVGAVHGVPQWMDDRARAAGWTAPSRPAPEAGRKAHRRWLICRDKALKKHNQGWTPALVRMARIKALGNCVVPQCSQQIGLLIRLAVEELAKRQRERSP